MEVAAPSTFLRDTDFALNELILVNHRLLGAGYWAGTVIEISVWKVLGGRAHATALKKQRTSGAFARNRASE
jgi:hypothetical protein